MNRYKPQYKNLRFKDRASFDKWLEETAHYIVEFEDHGQDFLKWWLDERGEVLHSDPYQSSVWNGTIVTLASLKKGAGQPNIGGYLHYGHDENGAPLMIKYPIKSVTEVHHG